MGFRTWADAKVKTMSGLDLPCIDSCFIGEGIYSSIFPKIYS